MARILVTGGAGYIGSHTVVALIQSGHTPVVVDNLSRSDVSMIDGIEAITGTRPTLHPIDVCHTPALTDVLDTEHVDAVIHFAAYKSVRESVEHPLRYHHNNIGGTVSLLQAMEASGCSHLVFSSSCTVYGQPAELPVTEQAPQLPAASPYGYTKQVCEHIIADAVAADGGISRAMSLRYFNPVGAHPSALIGELPVASPENLVPVITQTAAGWRPALRVFGNDYATPDGTAVRDYLHVMDLADAHVAAVDHVLQAPPGSEVCNLGTGTGLSVLQLIAAFEAATGVTVPYALAPRRPGDVEQVWSSCEHARTLLGWEAHRTLHDMMASAWAWQQTRRQP